MDDLLSVSAGALVRQPPSSLVRLKFYDSACRALAEAHRVDEVKEIRDQAMGMQAYARQAKHVELSVQATDIALRAELRLGEMMAEQRAAGLLATGTRGQLAGGSVTDPPATPAESLTLAEAGIDKHLAARARKAAAMPAEKYQAKIERQLALAAKAATIVGKAAHVKSESTGEIEWYTPDQYLKAARAVLGEIDLDPASSDQAQTKVRAKSYFTIDRDGLKQQWCGRVWLNPPYRQPYITDFMKKMEQEIIAERVTAALMLTHNYTDTEWFHIGFELFDAICFTRGRVKFYDSTGEEAAPTQGQAFFYYGADIDQFRAVFSSIGYVVSLAW